MAHNVREMQRMRSSTTSGFLGLPRLSVIGYSWNQSQDDIHRSKHAKYVEDVSEEIVEGDPLIQEIRSQLIEGMYSNNQ